MTHGPIPDLGHIEWKGRLVFICFDADWRSNPNVRKARYQLSRELKKRGANVRFFDISEDAGVKGFDDWCAAKGPEHVLEHFQAALEAPTELPPEYRNEEGWLVHIEQDGSTTRICSALDVVGRTSNTGSTGWGLLLRFADDDAKDHLVNVPSELLANPYGTEIRKLLLDQGLHFEPNTDTHRQFMSFLSHKREGAQRIYTTSRMGWSEDHAQYVLPGETLGPKSPKLIYMPPGGVLTDSQSEVSGTLDQWRDKISRYCSGNVLLALSVSAAFAGVLLRVFGQESGGIHFFGPSSKGKSTLLRVARSVYGCGPGSWNATKNGLEASAERYNDAAMFLDEMGESDAGDLLRIIYMLSNETGRTRMTSATTQARTAQWKLMILSSGEVSVTDHAGTAGKQVKAGTDIRLLNMPVEIHAERGAFQDLHEFVSSKELAEHLNENVRTYYGSAGRAFIEVLLTDREAKKERLREVINQFVRENLDRAYASEVQRVANRFALMAAAGTLATEAGITGWRKDDAYQACVDCYRMWIAARGTAGSTDDERALRQVRKFLELYGSSRFVSNEADNVRVDRCAGVREKDGSMFYISREVFASEVCSGFDPKRVAKMLAESGYLNVNSDGRYTKKPYIRTDAVSETRFYAVKASIFGDEADGEEEAA